MKDWEIVIADMPDREEPIAEVYFQNQYWVEIFAEVPNQFVVQFYSHPEYDYWEFPFDEAIKVLQEAKNRLAKLQRTPEGQAEYEQLKKEWEKYEQEWEEQQKKSPDQ